MTVVSKSSVAVWAAAGPLAARMKPSPITVESRRPERARMEVLTWKTGSERPCW